jgi:hypothetical protein
MFPKRNARLKEKDMATTTPTSIRVTRYVAGPALALGLAIGSSAAANAVWDVVGYDQCMTHVPTDVEESNEWHRLCCVNSGGVWNSGNKGCFAPPAEASGRNPLPSDAPTHVMQPLPLPGPPGDIGQAPGGLQTVGDG